jgi:HlyD family secretion protein
MKTRPKGLLMVFGVGAIAALTLSNLVTEEKPSPSGAPSLQAAQAPQPQISLAAPGRIEGRDQPVQVGAGADGVLASVFVREGQSVKQGTVLAQIDCRDLQASLVSAQAEAQSARESRRRTRRGARSEERRMAEQKTVAAKAVFDHATADFNRAQTLHDKQIVTTSEFDQAKQSLDVAQADYQSAVKNEQLVKAGALPEELAKADDDVEAADARVKSLSSELSKCAITAPIDGTILQILLKPGESFSTLIPSPILSMDDLSVRHVRTEVDERDVLKVWKGQPATVFSPEQPDTKYQGKVIEIATQMGRPGVSTGNPSDKSDRDVLETIVDLGKRAQALPVGLRVTVQFMAEGSPSDCQQPCLSGAR